MTTDWDSIFAQVGAKEVKSFVTGTVSGRVFSGTCPEARSLVKGGVDRARDLGRLALSRRRDCKSTCSA